MLLQAFVPPLLLVLLSPGIFITALNYAGTLCTILLVALPCLMAWSARYRTYLAGDYQVIGGKFGLALAMLVGVSVMLLTILLDLNWI